MKKILILLFFWLLLVNIFAVLALNRLNLNSDSAYEWIRPLNNVQDQSWNPVGLHSRWDSVYYEDIAKNGYHLTPGNTLSNVVFFPLYPLLIRLVAPLFSGNLVMTGWFISVVALIGAVLVFYKLLKEFHPKIDPETAIFYLLIFPTAFFLNAVYTESLFMLLSLLTFYFAFKRKFGLAGLFGMLAALTRVTGILLLIPVFWEFWKHHKAHKIFNKSSLSMLLIPIGTALLFLYHYLKFGDFLLFFKVESAWGRSFVLNKEHLLLLTNSAVANFLIDIAFVAFALICVYYAFKQKWVSYGLYMLATIGVALSSGTLISIGRYILVLFPMFIVLATIKNRQFERIYTLGSLLLFALNIALFVNWYWAG